MPTRGRTGPEWRSSEQTTRAHLGLKFEVLNGEVVLLVSDESTALIGEL